MTQDWHRAWVAVGALAKLLLREVGIEVFGYVREIGGVVAPCYPEVDFDGTARDASPVYTLAPSADGRMTAAMASLAKMNHAAKARAIVADARDILGGDGILLDNHVARHHADMEAIFTFEGTDSVQALIVGRDITGLSAISGRKPSRD